MKWTCEDIKPRIGSIVRVNKADILSDDLVRECLNLLNSRGVLVFPELNLSDEEQIAFTNRLGEGVNFARDVPGGTEEGIYKITLDDDVNSQPEYVLGTFFWHMDGLTQNMPPPKATLLSARAIAPKGGQTEFANTQAAYESLSDEEKAEIADLRVAHSVRAALRAVVDDPTEDDRAYWARTSVEMEHPLIWRQSSGQRSLVIGYTADRVVGMGQAEGRALLARLLETAVQPDFKYSHNWKEGDFVVWNNYCMLHRVIPYERTSGRMMHRTSVAGHERIS